MSGYAYAGVLNCTVATSTLPSTYTWSEAGVENAGHCSSTEYKYSCDHSTKHCDRIYACAKCYSGFIPKNVTLPSQGRCKTVTFEDYCIQCDSSCSGSGWTDYGTGYVRKYTGVCNCNGTCDKTYSYACAAGYYGVTSNGTSGCTPCPNSGTSAQASTSITSCYLPSGTVGSDSTGTYVYTSNCYYR